jgi:methylated-DNA-protein-cysteine methyltransferase-like protein
MRSKPKPSTRATRDPAAATEPSPRGEPIGEREPSARAARVLERVRATPPGFVRTYGDVSPGAPRFAGAVLHGCSDPSVPWQRIVRADGSLAKGERQRRLLEVEGVPFRGDRVDMRAARLPDLL